MHLTNRHNIAECENERNEENNTKYVESSSIVCRLELLYIPTELFYCPKVIRRMDHSAAAPLSRTNPFRIEIVS